jgi:type IV pilus assembly protein PilB
MARTRKTLGDILVEWGVTTPQQIARAEQVAKGSGKRLGEALVEIGATTSEHVAKATAAQFGMEYVDLRSDGSAKVDVKLMPEDLIKKHLVLPLSRTNGRLQLLIHDPMDLELLDMLRFRLNLEIEPRMASREAIKRYIDQAFGAGGARMVSAGESLVTESIDRTIDRSVDRSVDKSIDVAADDAPMVKLANRIITEAVRSRASDIHIEPMGNRVRLRYRIDGVCIVRDDLPKRMQNSLLSRVKLMAGVNIAERRVPQDGRIKMEVDGVQIDFRVSSCPAYHGESVVLRILRPESAKIGLVNLGFEPDNLAVFNKIIRRPNGIFLVTGPTGSGKTTTLYSALEILNRPDKKIITAEDPVEYNFAGMNQCQVHEKIGLTFTAILRSMLRQAPNIILVGEIRDHEVAEIAVQAALTGHLVFSTLHTNDAPSAITRLIDIGVKPFLVASSIQAVMAQRLVRILCEHCKALDPAPDPKYLSLVGITPAEAAGRVHRAVGCDRCLGTGYLGRKAVFEMMVMNSELRELAFRRSTLGEVRRAAIASGMRTLVADGKIKILRGLTTPDEVARMTQVDSDSEAA